MEEVLKPSPEKVRKFQLSKKVQNVKEEQSSSVLKYLMRRKSTDEIQSPIHNVEFHTPVKKTPKFFFKTFQKVSIDPHLKLDENKEEKWSMLTNNYKVLIERSKSQVSDSHDLKKTPSPAKPQFMTKRQSIEYRIKQISTPQVESNVESPPLSQAKPRSSQSQFEDPFYEKFKNFYKKMGIPNTSPVKLAFQIPKNNKLSLSKQKSSINTTPQTSKKRITIKISQQSLYLKELQSIFSKANQLQTNHKRDQSQELQQTNVKVNKFQAQFAKYHQMLTTDLEKYDKLEVK